MFLTLTRSVPNFRSTSSAKKEREREKKKEGGGERNRGREESKAALEKSTYRLDESCKGLKGGL